MKLLSWNVNGIRSCGRKTFADWFTTELPDALCVQETKASAEQLDEALLHPAGYHSYWHSAEKPGYSGVAIYSKKEPLRIQSGLGIPEIDREGRVLIAEYNEFTLVNAYFPNSQREHTRLPYKLAFCAEMLKYCNLLKAAGKNVVLCGDLNIAHREIDLKNPKTNVDNAGFLPEERAWMDQFIDREGYVDTFRHFNKEGGNYTWWSYRPGVRAKNIGWRLDYFICNPEFNDRLAAVSHQCAVTGSDHCPVELRIRR
ncbi:MAG: exodeoxyribonuclease III [Bdellovibrionota bacterium]